MRNEHVVPASAVPNIIGATFPSYRGKTVSLVPAENVTVTNLHWSGGSRSQWAACTLDGRAQGNSGALSAADPWRQPHSHQVAIPPGSVMVENPIFCGKPLPLRVYVHPSDMPRYLAAPKVALTRSQTIVVIVIRGLISSYRREEAQRQGISRAQYETTVAELKAMGLLSANGGLTVDGKNAANQLPSVNDLRRMTWNDGSGCFE